MNTELNLGFFKNRTCYEATSKNCMFKIPLTVVISFTRHKFVQCLASLLTLFQHKLKSLITSEYFF